MRYFPGKHQLFLLILLLMVFTSDAYAYLDPGTGSIILQILAAGLLSALFYFKSFWRKLKSLFSSDKASSEQNESND